MNHKEILESANAAISQGDHQAFLSYLTENTKWTFLGDQVLSGKEEVKNYITEAYKEPPKFDVELMIEEGNYVTAIGKISLTNEDNEWIQYDYCDVWRFENGKMAELKAFVIENK